MALERNPAWQARAKRLYTCPMHPEVVQDGPGECPKCGMALEPVEVDLAAQRITLASGEAVAFAIDADDRRVLMQGLDDIGRTLRHAAAIDRFEAAL